ncbi:hypothetical protein PYW08_009455 [Mythimna loreyi]|uniref:Uncharacterized protein n=1 Tax=Mythimna loreyi TaxID=667449 RepID=A0ACC2Q9U4_9NEOP|nr:hypothetical protein PYW08_009455 [Mythimna loreyi]
MTLKAAPSAGADRVRGYVHQALMVVLINVPTISFGLAMGWVSLASGEAGGEDAARVVGAAATTFGASLLGVPLSARALAAGRKLAVLATSAAFLACWSLKLCGGGWWVVAARACAGLGGAGAWSVAPLLAREMCSERVRGAAVSALVLAHNLGFLLMYLAADAQLPHRTVLWGCWALAAAHCALFLFVPESPPFLAAQGKQDEARAALAWLRGVPRLSSVLDAELQALPPPDDTLLSPLQLTKDLLSEPGRRRAFVLCLVVVVGQEACGVLALLQFAERVFVLARGAEAPGAEAPEAGAPGAGALGSPARHAVLLGAAQLVASVLALYLVEKLGRKRLIVWCGVATGLCLLGGAGAVWGALGGAWAGALLAGAVFADSAGLQPAPYAMLADMFTYQYRGCVVALVGLAAWGGNLVEVVLFPLAARAAGLGAALALGAALSLALAAFAHAALPETRGRTPQQIYDLICPPAPLCDSVKTIQCSEHTVSTKM